MGGFFIARDVEADFRSHGRLDIPALDAWVVHAAPSASTVNGCTVVHAVLALHHAAIAPFQDTLAASVSPMLVRDAECLPIPVLGSENNGASRSLRMLGTRHQHLRHHRGVFPGNLKFASA